MSRVNIQLQWALKSFTLLELKQTRSNGVDHCLKFGVVYVKVSRLTEATLAYKDRVPTRYAALPKS